MPTYPFRPRPDSHSTVNADYRAKVEAADRDERAGLRAWYAHKLAEAEKSAADMSLSPMARDAARGEAFRLTRMLEKWT